MVDSAGLLDEGFDELNYRSDGSLSKALDPNEQILLSTTLFKYNKKSKRQERSLLITSKAIYNVNNQDFFANVISVFNSSYKIRRKINIEKLTAVSVSDLSSEFVLHISDEYDYRYASPEKRDRILTVIFRAYYLNVKTKPLPCFFLHDVNLIRVTTTQEDKKNNVSRIPPIKDALNLNEDELKKKLDELNQTKAAINANTKTVFSKGGGNQKLTLDDFDLLKVLGRGAFGKVMLVEKRGTKQVYAMKSLHKEEIIDKDQIEHTRTERYVLEKSKSPFLVGLEFAFQTPDKIFFIMNFMKGGELFQHLRASRRFDERRAKFYAAEIILGLEYLHGIDVIYRDLKPENVLMDEEGHVCLTDFGMAKIVKEGELTRSFVGTPEYLAPEVIDGKGHTKPVDWWALGILIYEMLYGSPPFYSRDQTTQQMLVAIAKKEVSFSSNKVKIGPEVRDLITKLLTKNPAERLGTKSVSEIKEHKWFSDIDWEKLAERKLPPPFKPKVTNDYDVDNFDEEFTNEEAYNSVLPNANAQLVKMYQNEFKDFTYVPENGLLNNDAK